MRRSSRVARLVLTLVSLVALPLLATLARTASADPAGPQTTPIAVLDVQTDEADDQADALTQALRARVRSAAGWSLAETTQSLGKLMIVLKCPTKPDAACLQRIAETLKLDRFIWGQMTKKGNQVTADLHLWTRGKPEGTASTSYSENLKDPSEDALKKIATSTFAQLSGAASTGVVVVHAGSGDGAVLVDGVEKTQLANGAARFELPAGAHAIEVRVAGMDPWAQHVTVNPGGERELTATLTAAKTTAAPVEAEKSTGAPTRKIVAYSAIGLGVASMAFGVYEGINFLGLKSDLDNDRNNVSSSVTDVCADRSTPAAIDACTKYNDAKTARVMELVFLGAGAALAAGGVVLLVTDHGQEQEAPKSGRVKVLPRFSAKSVGVDLGLTF